MIAWTNIKLKLTSGIGALCTTALLADISRQTLPIWLVTVIALVPLSVFVFVRPDEMPRSIVLPLQIFAAVWYLVLSAVLSVLFFGMTEREKGWPIYFIGLAVGAVPCVAVLWRWLRPEASE
jgi:FtsH-binding integral membrane protein